MVTSKGSFTIPGWVRPVAALIIFVVGTTWAVSEIRHNDLSNIRTLNSLEHQIIIDSLKVISLRIRANTYRLCVLELELDLPLSQLCVDMFGSNIPRRQKRGR